MKPSAYQQLRQSSSTSHPLHSCPITLTSSGAEGRGEGTVTCPHCPTPAWARPGSRRRRTSMEGSALPLGAGGGTGRDSAGTSAWVMRVSSRWNHCPIRYRPLLSLPLHCCCELNIIIQIMCIMVSMSEDDPVVLCRHCEHPPHTVQRLAVND